MTWRIPLSDIDFGPDEETAVGAVVRSRWLTMGALTQAFEAEVAEFTGAKHAIALTNATAALHLACLAAGLGPGDEMPGTGGARKVRFAARGKGKSGGYRVITFYSGEDIPVFLLDVYAKGEKIDLTQSEKNELRFILDRIVKTYRSRPS